MKGLASLFLGIFGTFAFSWVGLTVIPNLQIGHLDPQSDEEGTDIYPIPKSGMVERGRQVYAANGCIYCHSQQLRADYAASDLDRGRDYDKHAKWGQRRSAPRDYIFDRPVLLGKDRMGPDLANMGKAAPSEEENAAPAASPAASTSPAASPIASPAPKGATPKSPTVSPTPSPAGSPAASPASATSASPSPVASPASQAAAPKSPTPSPTPSPGGSPAASPAAATSSAPSPMASPAPKSPTVSPTPSPSGSPAAVATASASPAPSPSPPAAVPEQSSAYTAAWHHRHLYSPRSIYRDSNMPAYRFLYQKRQIGGERSADALDLTGSDAPPAGWEIVPTFDAQCLVAYLMSLDQSHPLAEVKSAAPAAAPAAAATSPAPAPATPK